MIDYQKWRKTLQDGQSRVNEDCSYATDESMHGAGGKTTPVDADELALIDTEASNALKVLTWANCKATLKAYFDTLYHGVLAALTAKDYIGISSTAAAAGGHAVLRRKQYEGSATEGVTVDTKYIRATAYDVLNRESDLSEYALMN